MSSDFKFVSHLKFTTGNLQWGLLSFQSSCWIVVRSNQPSYSIVIFLFINIII